MLLDFYQQLTKLLVTFCQNLAKKKAGDFTKNRKLPLLHLILTLLFLAGGSRFEGVDIKLSQFYKAMRQNGLWPQATSLHRSALTKARSKLDWSALADLLHKIVDLAYVVFPSREEYRWQGFNVFGIDGSKFNLPSAQVLRKEFDPDSGLNTPGKGHYPQAVINTVYDVFRRIPVRRSVCSIQDGNEREQALALITGLPKDSVLLFDRGYPSYAFILALIEQAHCFLIRCPAQSTFPVVEEFVQSSKKEAFVYLTPSNSFQRRHRKDEHEHLSLRLRLIRLPHPDGTVSVLIAHLPNTVIPYPAIINLYYRRWGIENHYRDEKVGFEVERFHAKTINGVRQELFAILIVCVIARTLSALSVASESVETEKCYKAPQLKHAVKSVAQDIAVFLVINSKRALTLFFELVDSIRRVVYYRPKTPKPSKPRVNKGVPNKWKEKRAKKMGET